MAHWKRADGNPVTTESFLVVENEAGERGRIKIRQTRPGKISLYGGVYRVDVKYGHDGTPESEQTIVLDSYPTVDGVEVYRQEFAKAATKT